MARVPIGFDMFTGSTAIDSHVLYKSNIADPPGLMWSCGYSVGITSPSGLPSRIYVYRTTVGDFLRESTHHHLTSDDIIQRAQWSFDEGKAYFKSHVESNNIKRDCTMRLEFNPLDEQFVEEQVTFVVCKDPYGPFKFNDKDAELPPRAMVQLTTECNYCIANQGP